MTKENQAADDTSFLFYYFRKTELTVMAGFLSGRMSLLRLIRRSRSRAKFVVMKTLSIFGDWRQDCFRAILHRCWNGCTFHLRQLIVRVRSRLSWRNLCFENSFILSLGIRFVEDETSGLLFIQHCLVSVNKSWVSPILLITHLQSDCSFQFFRLKAILMGR